MINWLHSLFHNPARGWDPVSIDHAKKYARDASADLQLVNQFAAALGGLAGRRIADMGSGPGYYSLEFARLGAKVTCIDVSRTYLSMAKTLLNDAGFKCEVALGYMDSINETTGGSFDAIFSNVSWNYCMNDLVFARKLLQATSPGGTILIRETNEAFEQTTDAARSFVYWLNKACFWKIGHPHPPRGRIEMAFRRLRSCEVTTDYSNPIVDVVVVRKHPLEVLP